MLSLTLAKRVGWRESGQRAATRLAAAPTPARSLVATCTRRRSTCTASTTPNAAAATAAAAVSSSRRRGASLLQTTADSSRARGEGTTRRWTVTTAGFGKGYGAGSSSSSGWRNRRGVCSVGTPSPTTGQGNDGEGDKYQAAAAAAAPEGSEREMKGGKGVSGEGSSSSSSSSSGVVGGEQQQDGTEQNPTRRWRRPAGAAKVKSKPHYFGKPLSVLGSGSGGAGDVPCPAAGGGVDAEDELPDPRVIEVEREEDQLLQAEADANDPRTRVTAARPEVVHALSRGLAEGSSRQVADNLCSYATSERSAEDTLAQLEKVLLRRPYQAEWVMPLVRSHLTDDKKPSAQTHQEYLSYARNVNTKEVSLEDMAESLLRAHARRRWGPDMNREKLRTDHPERWDEAMVLAEKLADRLPVCRHKLLWKTLQGYLDATKTRRRFRFLQELSSGLRSSTHLVLPALAKFWRVYSIGSLQEDVDQTKQQHLKDQAALARWLLFARLKSLPTVAEFNGPWSMEELHELGEVRSREQEERETADSQKEHRLDNGEEEDSGFDLDGFDVDGWGEDEGEEEGWEGGKKGWSSHRRKKLDTAAVKLISQALPPQIPKMKPAPPLGLYDLYVVENPREMSQPPPRDIFGGDTPMGIGEAGASEPVEWQGRDEDAEWAMAAAGKAGGEYAWPEESEGEGEEAKESERPWWEGAGKKDLPPKRAKDYQEVKDVLLTGRRRRPPAVTWSDIDKDLAAIAIKTRLLERSALVSELHPDETRQIELQLQEEGSRTVFVNGLPYGLSPWTVKEAFSRCGPVHQVMIREPTFRDSEDGNPTPASLLAPGQAAKAKAKARAKPKRAFVPTTHGAFASSSPHGLVVFKDREGFDRATAESFRIFGVVIDGVAVTTKPAHQCRTLYVENFEMRTGLQMTDAINVVLEPRYSVGLRTHYLDDETPQVVAITFRSYSAVRTVDTLLTEAGFRTTFHYTVPKARGVKPEEVDLFPDLTKVAPAPGDERSQEQIILDKLFTPRMRAFSEEELKEIKEDASIRSLEDSLAPQHR